MLFADFQTWLGEQLIVVIFILALWTMAIKRIFKSNEQIKDAAKAAATRQTVNLIGRLFGGK